MEKGVKGKFITFEGSEGCGKSTQSRFLWRYLKRRGYDVVYLREPGGTRISEKIRKVLLDPKNHISDVTEMLLYMAARAQAVKEVIEPALLKGKIVICDRFLDSTLAYQGFGLGMDIKFIKQVGNFVTGRIKPDLTLFLDLPLKKGLKNRRFSKDRIEQRSFPYHSRVMRGYQKLASLEPKRIRIVKVEKDKASTHLIIRELVDSFLRVERYGF